MAVLNKMAARQVADAMTAPAVTIGSDRPLSAAVDLMLSKVVKRLPVTDDDGRFTGMISRDSLLRTGFGKFENPPPQL